MVYVGETSRSLKERAKEHEADVRLRREKPISEHFNGAGHRVQDMGIDCSDEILNKCEKIKQDASVKLMELTLVACEEKINKLRSDVCVEDLNNDDHKLFSKRKLAELTQKKNEKFYKLLNSEWERRMRLAEYFHSDENQERKNEKEEYEIKKESRFTPEPETSRSLKERAKEHEADVRLRREKPISEHFNGAGHRVQDMGHFSVAKSHAALPGRHAALFKGKFRQAPFFSKANFKGKFRHATRPYR
ncbi:hypothetical protein DPMN_113450 [Dreissena polymorpha]|uniref:GIY-YIG domain-containing protein n=1 Tax=Dreissena polymorpha TaxID=45954 RepID=A0A9D4KIB4_DREPO|nr:hypothetical protein DPMN_113450 [Dreissena polymorpha]